MMLMMMMIVRLKTRAGSCWALDSFFFLGYCLTVQNSTVLANVKCYCQSISDRVDHYRVPYVRTGENAQLFPSSGWGFLQSDHSTCVFHCVVSRSILVVRLLILADASLPLLLCSCVLRTWRRESKRRGPSQRVTRWHHRKVSNAKKTSGDDLLLTGRSSYAFLFVPSESLNEPPKQLATCVCEVFFFFCLRFCFCLRYPCRCAAGIGLIFHACRVLF